MSENEKFERIYGDYFKIIQGTINRMARNSFLIKAWTVTLVAAILVFTLSILSIIVLSILIGISLIFWGLDSYYLRLERLYRCLYNQKVEEYNDIRTRKEMSLFLMDTTPYREKVESIMKTMRSDTELCFYITIVGTLSIILIMFLFMLFF